MLVAEQKRRGLHQVDIFIGDDPRLVIEVADAAKKFPFRIQYRHAAVGLHFLSLRMAPHTLVTQRIGGVKQAPFVAQEDAVGGGDGNLVCRLQLGPLAIEK